MRTADIFRILFLVALQIVMWSLLNLSQYFVLTFLPTLILCLPTRMSPVAHLLIAFLTGLCVDFFSCGVLGHTAAALVPVALLRPLIIRYVFGSDLISRGENVNVNKLGLLKMLLGCLAATAVFLVLYVWIDSAGTRPFGFNLARFLLSLISSSLLSLLISDSLCFKEASERWN